MLKAATGLIIKEGKLLMVKRADNSDTFPGYWACPAGRADGDELPEETAVREVKEEVNLDFRPAELFMRSKWEDRDLYRFLGDWSGEIKIQESELSGYAWFTYDEAIKLKLAFDYREVIEKLHKDGLL